MDDLNNRYNINGNRFTLNEDGTYLANRALRKEPKTDKEHEQQYLWFDASTQEYIENTRHPDGCFKCPRCKLFHYVPDNYDLLCDPCVSIVLEHPKSSPEMLEGVKQWVEKKRVYWSKARVPDKDIEERLLLRDKLINDVAELMVTIEGKDE